MKKLFKNQLTLANLLFVYLMNSVYAKEMYKE